MSVRYCTDFEGIKHCGSCHDEWDEGWNEPFEVYQSDVDDTRWRFEEPVLALGCCISTDAIVERLRKEQAASAGAEVGT